MSVKVDCNLDFEELVDKRYLLGIDDIKKEAHRMLDAEIEKQYYEWRVKCKLPVVDFAGDIEGVIDLLIERFGNRFEKLSPVSFKHCNYGVFEWNEKMGLFWNNNCCFDPVSCKVYF